MGLRKLLAGQADQRRRSVEKQAQEIEARRTSPFQSVLQDGETIVQYTPARTAAARRITSRQRRGGCCGTWTVHQKSRRSPTGQSRHSGSTRAAG
jgi:hypothetical protein